MPDFSVGQIKLGIQFGTWGRCSEAPYGWVEGVGAQPGPNPAVQWEGT